MAATTKPAPKVVSPFEPLAKLWKRTQPVRKTLAWCFVLHGAIRLSTDLWAVREPFILADVREWWGWTAQRIAELRGVKVVKS